MTTTGPGIFDALADPVRRRLVELLAQGNATAGDLADLIGAEFGISQPASSQHLRVLREAEVVTGHQDGRRRLYRLRSEALAAVTDWVAHLRGEFDQPLDALATEIARGKRRRRTEGAGRADSA